MLETVKKLIALEKILQDNNVTLDEFLRKGGEEVNELYDGLCCEVEDCLITKQGNTNYDFVNLAEDMGIHIGPGEKDRFGWLTGVITFKDVDGKTIGQMVI